MREAWTMAKGDFKNNGFKGYQYLRETALRWDGEVLYVSLPRSIAEAPLLQTARARLSSSLALFARMPARVEFVAQA